MRRKSHIGIHEVPVYDPEYSMILPTALERSPSTAAVVDQLCRFGLSRSFI